MAENELICFELCLCSEKYNLKRKNSTAKKAILEEEQREQLVRKVSAIACIRNNAGHCRVKCFCFCQNSVFIGLRHKKYK